MPLVPVNSLRDIKLNIDLGGEQVRVERVEIIEELGRPFVINVRIVADLGEIDLLPHLGKEVGVELFEDEQLMRRCHGILTDSEFLGSTSHGYHYRLTARPFTYFLAQNRDMAIFQNLTTPEIIEKVFSNAGVTDFTNKLTRTYAQRVYCVQYRESDFDFLSRLMEEEGIYYHFEHQADKHVLVLCDGPSAHPDGTPPSMAYNTSGFAKAKLGAADRGGIGYYVNSLGERVSSTFQSRVTLRDFDFTKPERPLQAESTDPTAHAGDTVEVYDYPGRFNDLEQGATFSGDTLATLRRDRVIYTGRSQATSVLCGTLMQVTGHPTERLNQRYLVTRIRTVSDSEHYAADQILRGEENEDAHVEFDAIPADTLFRPQPVTPKPITKGLESAIVSGPEGEEIYTDEYGRVRVRFHWDRGDTPGENSTCWIRCAQFGGLGNVILPRIGQEVMVDFLHGDPDQPIVMGWVFNAAQMPVYALPENKTRSTWRSRSYPGGNSTDFADASALDTGKPAANEIRFEDKSGEEEVFIHAEKDMNLRVRNDQTNHVGHNQYEKVFWDREAFVGRDEAATVKRNQTLTINDGDQTEKLEKGSRTVTVEQGNDTLAVKMGNISIKADMGKIEIEAMQSITLTVGSSKITIDQFGIKVESMMIKAEASLQLETKGGVMAQHQGGAMNTIKGGIVMIN